MNKSIIINQKEIRYTKKVYWSWLLIVFILYFLCASAGFLVALLALKLIK